MDVKIITGFLLWFCFIASLSISLTASATLDSRQRFRRQNDESVACPEGTKPCKDDNTMCVTYCNRNSECTDGSDELDCATHALATSLPITEIVASIQSTESSGIEIERADVPQTTTDAVDDTVPTINILDQQATPGTIAPAVADVVTTEQPAAKGAQTTAVLADGTTIVILPETTAVNKVQTPVTVIDADGTTIAIAPGTTGIKEAPADTTVKEVATATVLLADGTTIVPPQGTTGIITAAEGATTAASETVVTAATTATADVSGVDATTTEAVTTEATGTNAAASGNITAVDIGLETSTIILVDNGTDIFTSVQPGNGNGNGTEDNNTTAVTIPEGATTDQVTTAETFTIDSNVTTITDNETTTDTGVTDVTTLSLNDTATGNDTLCTTTLDTFSVDEYEDESIEDTVKETTTTGIIPLNDATDEDAAINDNDVITSTRKAQRVQKRTATTSPDDIEYYDDPDEDILVEYLTASTTVKTTTFTKRHSLTTTEPIEYYDDEVDIDGVVRSITTTIKTTIITTTTTQRVTSRTTLADVAEYYDDENDEIEKGNQTSEESSSPDVKQVTTPTPVQPTPGGRVELRVVVSPEILQVQRGGTYTITCGVYGADASTTIYWIQEEPERRYALTDAVDPNDKQITMSQVSLTARITIDDPSKIGKYTCMAQDAAGNSGSAILTMQESRAYVPQLVPVPAPGGSGSGYLRIVAPDMADGDYVEIQCEGVAPEDEGRIQWFFNNRLLSDEQPLYPRGKTLHIRPISRPYLGNYRCSVPGSSYADGNSVLTFGSVPSPGGPPYGAAFTVTVEIVQGQTVQGQAQENTQVILRCRPSEQASSYRWTFTSNQGTVDRGYSDQLVLPQATVQDSGVYTCEATSARGESARGSTNLHITSGPSQPVTGRCSIDEATCRNGKCIPRAYLYDGKNDCGDNSDEAGPSGDLCQPNEIRCTNPGRGRKCVQKFWMCDGDRDCDDGSDEDQHYCDLLPRQRYCKSSEFHCGGPNATTPNPVCIPRSFQCDGYNDCPDRSDEIGCVKPAVVAAPQRQIQINVGQTLTIQCTARGSPAPYINWRLNWGHVCNDGSDNGRCVMAQSIDTNDPSLVTGTLTVRNVNTADGGAYSCEALNNQGFIFAIPDAIVDVIIDPSGRQPQPSQQCNCNGHSSVCSPDGRCLNCQHNTAGYHCEFCAPGYQGDARQGSINDCLPITGRGPSSLGCDPSGTHMERGDRCICKYNVEGDRCDQCKRSHFHLNPTTPNGCLPCFCSGVSTDCRSSDWRRQATALPLKNWNVVPKNFATDQYEAGNRIQQRRGGRELALDQSSLGRPANEVLYWKAPRTALGDLVTLYDGNIDIHFINDGQENEAPSNDEFIWLRGNNIDLIHKLPQSQRFKANTNATYSVPCNERTFTRKDGTYIDRENILMALSDVDTLLVKINPIGGRRNAVLRGVTLNVAAQNGYADGAPTVESCSCPANYTGTSCEKCAEGYGRPHPLVGIYLGQCWSCRSLCHDRSDRCDRETGKCFDCQGNSEGDRCERCRPGYILDARINQCVPEDQYQSGRIPPSSGPGPRGSYYLDQRPYDSQSTTPLNIVLDGSQPEQRIPLQVLNVQPQSVVWGRTDGSSLPAGVVQEGNDLVFRNPSSEQAGNYICTITHPDGGIDRVAVYLDYRPGQPSPVGPSYGPSYGYPVFSPPSPLAISEGSSQFIEPQGAYYRVDWRRDGNQALPPGIYQDGNGLRITNARPDQSGTYYCELYGPDGRPVTVPYEIRIQASPSTSLSGGGQPRIRIEPRTISLKEGQRMIVQYTVSSHDPIEVIWNKLTSQGLQPLPAGFSADTSRLILSRATLDAAGTYQVLVRNPHGEDRQQLEIIVEPRRGRGRGQQATAPQIRFQQDRYDIGSGEVVDVTPNIYGDSGATITWSKDGSTYLPNGVTARSDGSLHIEGQSNDIDGRYTLDVTNAYGRASSPIHIRWRGTSEQQSGVYGGRQDGSRSYIDVRLESRDEQSHQVGRDIHLQCTVQGSAEQPYEYTYTKDGRPLENNVEVHPSGALIIRNAQTNDAGRYRCEVTFPRAPEVGTQESSYDLRIEGGSAGDYGQYGGENQQQSGYIEAVIEPNEATVGRGEKVNLTCNVKGAQQYTVTWSKYAHDTSLPDYVRQQGSSIIVAPTDDSPAEQMYLQCSANVPGQAQPYSAYAPVTIRANDELRKKKKKRRSS